MKQSWTVFLAACALAFSSGAFAVSTATGVSFSCTGGDFQSLSSDGFTASCGGDFDVSGGTLFSDAWIRLTAGGALRIDDVSLTAPRIDLSGDQVSIGSASFINGSSLAVGEGPLVIARGGSTLPERGSGATVTVVGGGDISLGGGTVLTVGDGFVGGRITLNGGGSIELLSGDPSLGSIAVSQVPEVPVHLMWLLGVGVLAGLGRRGAARERLAVV